MSLEKLIALAGREHVSGYRRKTKGGKTVTVSQYTRSPGDMSPKELADEISKLTKAETSGSGASGIDATRNRTRKKLLERELASRARTGSSSPAGMAEKLDPLSFGPPDRDGAPRAAITDKEYEAHVKNVRKILADPKTIEKDTTLTHGVRDANGEIIDGMYKEERAAQHRKIIASILNKNARVPRDRKAVMSGGLGGAGKGYVLEKYADISEEVFLTIDPDEMKKELIERGMAPEVEGLAPMEMAALLHEESSHLAKFLTKAATARGMNVIIDGTMADGPKTVRKAEALRAKGYDVEAVFVDVPLEVSLQSALDRHRGGLDRLRSGESPLGGRFVPPEYLEASRMPEGSEFLSRNSETFAGLQKSGAFSRARVFDNSKSKDKVPPKLTSDVWTEIPPVKQPELKTASQRAAYAALIGHGMSPAAALAAARRLP